MSSLLLSSMQKPLPASPAPPVTSSSTTCSAPPVSTASSAPPAPPASSASSASSAPAPASFSAASAGASSRGRRRASALLMEQLTRELSASDGRRGSLQSNDGYDRMQALASVGMLDFLDSFQLGMGSRNNSLHLGRDNSFSSVLGSRNSINLGAMDSGSGSRGSISAGSHGSIRAGSISAGSNSFSQIMNNSNSSNSNSNSSSSSSSNNDTSFGGGRGGSALNRRRSRRLSGGSASILSELAEAAKASAAGSAWTGGGRRGSLQPFAAFVTDPSQGGGLSAPPGDTNARRFSLRVALDEMAFYANPPPASLSVPIPAHGSKKRLGKAKRKKNGKMSGTKRKARPQSSSSSGGGGGGGDQKRNKAQKRVSNRTFEARRRNRVNAAMKQLKKICEKPATAKRGKGLTKIDVLERAIQLLRKKYNEPVMDLKAEYEAADASTEKELSSKAQESGAADIRRSIRERKRRMRVNILEKEIARLALSAADTEVTANASKCTILERACEVLGQPVPPLEEEEDL